MSATNPEQTQLHQFVSQLLNSASGMAQLNAAAQAFYALCVQTSGLKKGQGQATHLTSGIAIAPFDAARCIQDFMRTAKFLQGLEAAILEVQRRFPGERLNILYAGCGPFAPLALAMATRFEATAVRFVLLDIHAESLDTARNLFHTMGLAEHIGEYVLADATTWTWPAGIPLHLIITETMQQALAKEPQVAIACNLAPQLCEGGLLVPENIRVEAMLCQLWKEWKSPDPKNRAPLGVLMDLNKDTVVGKELFQEIIVKAPDDLAVAMHGVLFTTITVFGHCVLHAYESGITYPLAL